MRAIFEVARQVLGEAVRRKWVLAIFLGITGLLVLLAFSLQFEVLDGALAASRLFGKVMQSRIQAVDVALRPLLQGASSVLFYGGLIFGILACADFAPSLLAPGRIEHLLSLPIQRWQLLVGTFLGVFALSLAGTLYGALGFTLLLGLKAKLWTAGMLVTAVLASACFATLYAGMLAVATWVRSAALSAAVGGGLFILGIVASHRTDIASVLTPGLPREAFLVFTAGLPRVATLGTAAMDLATRQPLELRSLISLIASMGVFALGLLTLGIWNFEEKDY